MNDFFHWNLTRIRPFDQRPALTEAQRDALFDLFKTAGLPDTAMNVEMADGYITGCELSPQPVAVHEWMEGIFGQPSLPICADPAQEDRLLELLVQRHWDIMTALSVPRDKVTHDNLLTLLQAEIPDSERIRPYQLDAQKRRLGKWDLKDWADGFFLAIRQDDEWETLARNLETSGMLAPLVLLQLGYNPDQRDQQTDDNSALVPHLVASLYVMRDHWRVHHRAMLAAHANMKNPFVHEASKTGRNDPCPCGSGKKFKKCCGAA
jgi:uncharacterized protein